MSRKKNRYLVHLAYTALLVGSAVPGCGEVDLAPDATRSDASNIDAASNPDATPGTDGPVYDAAPSYFSLTITLAGSGSGTVVSAPSGIDCGDTCSHSFLEGTVVTLTATPAGQSNFGGWSGACSGTESCVVTMDEAKSVTAAFNPPGAYSLSVALTGNGIGEVNSNPAGIACGDDCTEQYTENTTVTLTPSAGANSVFAGWGGACSGALGCAVTMTEPTAVSARFDLVPHLLTVTKLGDGSGTITSSPPGIDCGTDCSESYIHGTVVTLTASAQVGSTFAGWVGGGCSGVAACEVTVNDAISVSATFTENQYQLTVILAGNGEGGVTSTPAGINCGTNCTATYPYGTNVALDPEPIPDSVFVSWSGACTGSGNCVVSMIGDREVTATFQDPTPNYNVAFVSPEPVTGLLGGLAGADAMCAQWGADAGFPGTYRAILSTSSTPANSRLAGARGWIRPDGRPVGDLPGDIFTWAGPLAPLRITSTGEDVSDARVWSASNNDGTFCTYNTDCIAWTTLSSGLDARYGFANVTSEWLDRGGADNCGAQYRLYCFQVDHNTPLDMDAFAEPGRRIFVTTGNFTTTTGLIGADTLCAADVAATPELAGKTFLAFLADNGSSAASRFASSNTPIVRMDGLRVANNFNALISQDLIHPPAVRVDGTYETWRVFSGAQTPTEAGTAASTCSGWTNASSGNSVESFAYSTSLDNADREWFGGSSGSCASHSGSIPVYCLEVE